MIQQNETPLSVCYVLELYNLFCRSVGGNSIGGATAARRWDGFYCKHQQYLKNVITEGLEDLDS